jgi:hypothetical protein
MQFFEADTWQQCLESASKKGITVCHNGYPQGDGECWVVHEGSRIETLKL